VKTIFHLINEKYQLFINNEKQNSYVFCKWFLSFIEKYEITDELKILNEQIIPRQNHLRIDATEEHKLDELQSAHTIGRPAQVLY
jgi:hypothetical protein